MLAILVTCIVIPCYNEQKGISIGEYSQFLNASPEVLICFVNDGSSDETQKVLEILKEKHNSQIHIISYQKNLGKAEAVRTGINYCNKNYNHRYIGYLDADLSATPEEFMELQSHLKGNVVFCFGSRIMKIGSTIVRDNNRFIIGRIIATFISKLLRLKVYDTQCGCKIFTKEISILLFEKKIISKWLFDVELFYRMIAIFDIEKAVGKMLEVPLKQWIEKGDSKVKISYFFILWLDLYKINRSYKINVPKFIPLEINLKSTENDSKEI